jgi:hypothetical protein
MLQLASVLEDLLTALDEAPSPRPGIIGPFETDREAASCRPSAPSMTPRASTRREVMGERNHQLLEETFTASGVELGAYDHRILLWMASWEPEIYAVVAGWVAWANRDSSFTAAELATIRQALADASAWRLWRTGDCCTRSGECEEAHSLS